jgi:transposase
MHGDVHAVYNPTNVVLVERDVGEGAVERRAGTVIGLEATRTINPLVYDAVTRRERFRSTTDKAENLRLKRALIERFIV